MQYGGYRNCLHEIAIACRHFPAAFVVSVVGVQVGAGVVGIDEGATEGDDDGPGVGETDGICVGAAVGQDDFSAQGFIIGEEEGSCVDAGVGSLVGARVWLMQCAQYKPA